MEPVTNSVELRSGRGDGLLLTGPHGSIEVHVRGHGPLVVLIPSLGRAASDFNDLMNRVTAAGYRVACPEPRGIGASAAPIEGASLADFAADIAAVIEAHAADRRAVVIGHAFGNRVARVTATEHPERVRGVVLLACGGRIAPEPEASLALRACFDTSLTSEEHLEMVRSAFFAPGNNPSAWAHGWHPDVATHQAQATERSDVEEWWDAGSAPVLVVQPLEDRIAPPANAHDVVARLGARAELVEVARAGHALLPEEPRFVAETIITWLDRLHERISA